MKKQTLKTTIITLASVGLLGTVAQATTYVFDDTWTDWPGYNSGFSGDVYGGSPLINNMTADVNKETGTLNSVTISFYSEKSPTWFSRVTYDTLFINTSYATDNSWDDWDYIIRDGDNGSHYGSLGNGVYKVNDPTNYDYIMTLNDGHSRKNTPTGISESDLTLDNNFNYTITVDQIKKTLTYTFTDGLSIGNGFYLAYGPYCGNDVIGGGSPIPEPATMLLFGAGLLGVIGAVRRKN